METIFEQDKVKYFGQPITEEILVNYDESTSWLRANIFMSENTVNKKIGIGFIGTGGGGNLFDYLFRDKSSRALMFAEMPYYQEALYSEYQFEFETKGIYLVNNKFYKEIEGSNPQQISAASEYIANVLCNACTNKINRILYSQQKCIFENTIALSLTVDFGSENEKPARFFVQCGRKTFGYLFSEKDSRQKMNNTIAMNILNILSNEINYSDFVYDSVILDMFPCLLYTSDAADE